MHYQRFDATDFADAIKEELTVRQQEQYKRQQAIQEAVIGPYRSTWQMYKALLDRRDIAGLNVFEPSDEFIAALKHSIFVLETSPLVRDLPEREQRLAEYRAELHRIQSNLEISTNTASTVEASSVAPENEPRLAFRPRIGWQIALFGAWLTMRKLHGREPSATEAIRYLKQNDNSGMILRKGGDRELWWKPQRGNAKEVAFGTVENTISAWRTKGVLPA